MSRKSFKAKEPVKIRTKKIKDGNLSIYMDYMDHGKRVREFLKLYYIPERTPVDKEKNEQTRRAVEAIMADKIRELINGKARIKTYNSTILLVDWIARCRDEYMKKGNKSYLIADKLIPAVKEYSGGKVRLCDVDKEYAKGFCRYLMTERKNKFTGEVIKPATAVSYFGTMCSCFTIARQQELILDNPFLLLNRSEKPQKGETTRTYLTPAEIKKMENAHCPGTSLKQVFLFACYCGLRQSDLRALTWGDIVEDGPHMQINLTMQKTKRVIAVPISKMARKYLPPRGDAPDDARVFFVPATSTISDCMRTWCQNAGIHKKITFHSSRHTFATLLLSQDVNLAVVQSLLGHTDIETTQIYAKVIDKKKVEAVDSLNNIFAPPVPAQPQPAVQQPYYMPPFPFLSPYPWYMPAPPQQPQQQQQAPAPEPEPQQQKQPQKQQQELPPIIADIETRLFQREMHRRKLERERRQTHQPVTQTPASEAPKRKRGRPQKQ